MQLKAAMNGTTLVIRVAEDRIDAAGAIQFKERMRDLIQTPCDRVILDLSPVHFLDSSGLGAVVAVIVWKFAKRGLRRVRAWLRQHRTANATA